jgi:hypothetical protein
MPIFGDIKLNYFISEWLPGGCILHHKKNIIYENYFKYKGKAYCEDIIHSILLTKNNIKLYIDQASFINNVGLNTNINVNLLFLINYCYKQYKIRLYIVKMISGNYINFHIWFFYFSLQTLFNYIKYKIYKQ